MDLLHTSSCTCTVMLLCDYTTLHFDEILEQSIAPKATVVKMALYKPEINPYVIGQLYLVIVITSLIVDGRLGLQYFQVS